MSSVRVCGDCGAPVGPKFRYCSECAHKRELESKRRYYARKSEDPEFRAKANARSVTYRAAVKDDPERAARRKASKERYRKANLAKKRVWDAAYRERVRNDPERNRERLENLRIDRRLKAEREGRQLRHRGPDRTASPATRVAADPLRLALIAYAVRHRAELNGHATEHDNGWKTLAVRTGIPERRIWELMNSTQRNVTLRVADALLLGVGSTLAAHYDLETLEPLETR
jgi:hypothetical protein